MNFDLVVVIGRVNFNQSRNSVFSLCLRTVEEGSIEVCSIGLHRQRRERRCDVVTL